MSYTVLARKWRPKNFAELVGQTHVMQALSNALDQQRLHHAYLFTGTRGVGKTTIARIFAKALNCEQGITSKPCGQCSVCQSIDQGRFVDLIEVDAASRTKVEDTREILDNVQYAPTQGRFKVYLIDEVHMLSKSSFNALLKTLEEPPEHVKFLLATTDPHKLPITVLSRCLQFNLLRLTREQIQQHLSLILQAEGIDFEPSALALIAKGADGSARDALSLMDQAIAYCGGRVTFEPVQTMLGLVDQGQVLAILQALAEDSAPAIRQVLQQLAGLGVDYVALLNQLLEALHQLSFVQILGEAADEGLLPKANLTSLAEAFTAERVQLLYQIGLLAQQDMKLAPDVRIGFEMALLRMLAFKPQATRMDTPVSPASEGAINRPITRPKPNQAPVTTPAKEMTQREAEAPKIAKPTDFPNLMSRMQQRPSALVEATATQTTPKTSAPEQTQAMTPAQDSMAESDYYPDPEPGSVMASAESEPEIIQQAPASLDSMSSVAPIPTVAPAPILEVDTPPWQDNETPAPVERTLSDASLSFQPMANQSEPVSADVEALPRPLAEWSAYVAQMHIDGMALALARHVILVRANHQAWWLSVDPTQLAAKTEIAQQRLLQAARACFGEEFDIHYVEYEGAFFTLNRQDETQLQQKQAQAKAAILQDVNVQTLQSQWDMTLLEQSIGYVE